MKISISIPGKAKAFPGIILFLFLTLGCNQQRPIELTFQWNRFFPKANSFYPIFKDNKAIFSNLDENCKGGIYALEARTGKTIWEICDNNSTNDFYYKLKSTLNGNSLILPKGNELISVDMNLGKTKWEAELFTSAEQTIVDEGNQLFRTYYDNRELKAKTLKIDKKTGNSSLFYEYPILRNTITKLRTPVFTNYRKKVLAHFAISLYNTEEKRGDAYMLTFDSETNTIVDSLNIISNDKKGKGITKELVCRGQFVYLFATDKVVKYNIDSKSIIWEKIMPDGMVTSAPFFTNEHIYFAAENGILYAIDIENGEIAWESKISGTPSCIEFYRGHLFLIGGGNGLLYIINESTGELYKKLSVNDLGIKEAEIFFRAFGIHNNNLYLLSQDKIHCFALN